MRTARQAGKRGRLSVKPPGQRFANAASLNLPALRADIDALHGTGG
jgi:hypothetical protein